MEEISKEEQERQIEVGQMTEEEKFEKFTHKYKALWDRYFWLKDAREHRERTIGLEETPEEKAMRLDFIEWSKKQPWNLEEQDTTNK